MYFDKKYFIFSPCHTLRVTTSYNWTNDGALGCVTLTERLRFPAEMVHGRLRRAIP